MAKRQQKKGKSSLKEDRNKKNSSNSKFNFKDAVLDASKFLSKSGKLNNEIDDNDSDDFQFDDEELDSDDALGSGDELDDYMVKKSTSNSNTNEFGEDDDGWESVDEGELITLSEMWDRDDKDLKSSKVNESKLGDQDLVFDDNDSNDSSNSDSGEESSDDESDEDSGSSESEDDDPFDEMELSDEEAQLDTVLKSLTSKSKDIKSRKTLINDKLNENEFLLPNQGDSLGFDDMIDDLDEDNVEFEENEDLIRDIAKNNRKLKELAENGDLDDDDKVALNNNENTAFSIPLPLSVQKRHERRAAYEIQKDQVNRWKEIIAQNRDKEVLKFVPEKVEIDKNSAFKTDSDMAINDFEHKLDAIINESNVESKKTEDLFENIETAKLSKAEMMKRTNELRLMRELMYRGMKDSKRLKKIKSKAYRRHLRKDKQKEQMLISQSNLQEGIENSDHEDDEMYQRAKERMTLKHKNTSAWAKKMIKSGMSKDKANRDELEEMMRQSDSLKLKQLGKRNGEESSDDDRNLSDLEHDIEKAENVDDEKLSKVGKGVLAMDFMKNAEERERLIRLKEIEDLRRHVNNEYNDQDEFGNTDVSGVNVTLNSGRRLYTPSAIVAAEESRKLDEKLLEELDEEDSRLLKNRLAVKERENVHIVNERVRKERADEELDEEVVVDDDESNPWLNENESNDEDDMKKQQSKRSTKIKVMDASSSKMVKAEAKIAKNLSKRKANTKDDYEITTVKIENKETLEIVDPKRQSKTIKNQSDDEYESDANDEDDNRMFKQTDLIKEAFAGDDVLVEEFEREKHAIEEDEGDKVVDLTVPGWGSWAGVDDNDDDNGWNVPKNNKKRKIVKTIQGVVSKDKRLDKDKAKVIINERVNKRNTKYQADKIPWPYKTWEEYERSLRIPMGKEWTTTETHQRLTTPKVITKFGSVIDPLKAPFSE
ncbi:hypothetical protein CANINC_002668 [Pichia inconspicua]|uniref:U3 small nucleolar RNA-associated protein 14 n=1 Tax=Pichia inconspicua TaxID=52247 RepID=A0A4T0X0Z9_9ASCO|nr:hypothetical protein CANINC_002668 [[Candida] inconspicua]